MPEKCSQCVEMTEQFNDDGTPICEDCAFDNCSQCMLGDCEVETPQGDYICADCYSGNVDYAHDMQWGYER